MAIIDWCKVFGAKYNNDLHYSKNVEIEMEGLNQIKDQMILFRNKYIAHKDKKDVPVPMLDAAIAVIYEFDQKIRGKYDLEGYQDLEGWYETYIIRVEDVLKQYGIEE